MPASLQELFSKGVDGLNVDGLNKELPGALPLPWDQQEATDQAGVPLAPYIIDAPLAAAAWVALLLRQPLFLTGDPGVGKTRFADALAERLGLGRAQRVQVKSDTKGRDLLYSFDELARFRDATRAVAKSAVDGKADPQNPDVKQASQDPDVKQTSQGPDVKQASQRPDVAYVRLRGLGRAILRAAGAAATVTLRTGYRREDVMLPALWKKTEVTLGDLFPEEFTERGPDPCHSVVLIDEIDKAPRDAPNDLLWEIEAMSFEMEEIGISISAEPEFKPVVIITSNSERNLPDAFLRRCVFYNMTLPCLKTLCKIAVARLGNGLKPDSAMVKGAAAFFNEVSGRITEKKPGTAEFIGLIAYLQKAGIKPDDEFDKTSRSARDSLKVLVKTQSDLTAAERYLTS
jgi:MoxR-like ATPase